MPNHSLVLYVTDVFRPTALALKMDERNRIQVNPKPSSQRTMSFPEYRNFGLGEGAAGSASSSGTANAVMTNGASSVLIGCAAGKKDAPLAVQELTKDGLGAETATRPGSIFVLSFVSGAAGSCACATPALPSTSNAVAKSFMMVLPSEGWPHAWE